jgi:hypothetical protein
MANKNRGGGIFKAIGRYRISYRTLYFNNIFKLIITISLIKKEIRPSNLMIIVMKRISLFLIQKALGPIKYQY